MQFLSLLKNTSIYSSSLATRRGRAIMMTNAFAFMAEYGPINTMEHNVQEVVDSITCMYTQVAKEINMLKFSKVI